MAEVEKICEDCGGKFIAVTLHQKVSWQKFCDKCNARKNIERNRLLYHKRKASGMVKA